MIVTSSATPRNRARETGRTAARAADLAEASSRREAAPAAAATAPVSTASRANRVSERASGLDIRPVLAATLRVDMPAAGRQADAEGDDCGPGDGEADRGEAKDQIVGALATGDFPAFMNEVAHVADAGQIADHDAGEARARRALAIDRAAIESADIARGAGGRTCRGGVALPQPGGDGEALLIGQRHEARRQIDIVVRQSRLQTELQPRRSEFSPQAQIGQPLGIAARRKPVPGVHRARGQRPAADRPGDGEDGGDSNAGGALQVHGNFPWTSGSRIQRQR